MKIVLACLITLGVCLAVVGVASAAPGANNPNVEILPLECDGLASFDVVKPDNAAAAFSPQGVLVVKRLGGDVTGTVTTFDGEEFGPFSDVVEEGGPGKGYEERLVECSFTETFTETFTLDAETAGFFGIPDEYVGTEVTLEGTFSGTASGVVPGQH